MIITGLEIHKCSVKFAEPVSISFHTSHYSENYFLRVQTGAGFSGWGEGAPFKPITGDSEEEVKAELPKLRVLVGSPLHSCDDIPSILGSLSLQSASLRAAVDFALHDLCAQQKNVPVYKLFQEKATLVPNSVTVFIKPDVEKTIRETERIVSLYPHLKVLKIKLQGSGDLERCRAIHAQVSKSRRALTYVLDANQGYSDPELAVRELNAIIHLLGDVLIIEEPCPKHDYKRSRFVSERIEGAKIFADESCCSIQDLHNIIEARAFHGINIKLQKAGGIIPAKQLAVLAAANNLGIMVGQMFESPLSTAASLAAAVTSNNILITDLDMDLDLPSFTTGRAGFSNGCRVPLESPGLSFALLSDQIEKLVESGRCKYDRWLI